MIRSTFKLFQGVQKRSNNLVAIRLFNPSIYFLSSTEQRKQSDKHQLFDKLNSLFEVYKKDNSRLSDLEMMAKQLNPYLGEINAKEYMNLTDILLNVHLVDQSTAKKLLERGYYFFDTKQIKLENFLYIVNSILQPDHQLQEKQLSLLIDLVDKVDYTTINPNNLPDTLSIVSKLKAFNIFESEDLNKRVVEAIKSNYGVVNINQIGQLCMSLALMQIEDDVLWDNLENYLIQQITNMPYQELVRSGTALIMAGDRASKLYWKMFFDQISQTVKLQTPDGITQTMLLLTQGEKHQDDVYKSIEESFLSRYAEFDTYNTILMFASFGMIQKGTEIWTLFDEDLPGFLESGQLLDVSFMLLNIFPMIPQLKSESKDIIQKYIIKNGSQFRDDVKEDLHKEFEKLGIMNDDIEQALDKNRLWV